MKRKVIVFGATGEIGGRIACLARDAGHDVTGVCRGSRKTDLDLTGIKFIHGDKFDESFITETAKNNYDAVIDSVPMAKSMALYHKHFRSAENVFVCSSTGVYVPLTYFPADEKHEWRKDTSLNFIHRSREDMDLLERYENSAFPITIFRPTNIIGEGCVPLELWGGRNIEFYRILKRGEPIVIPRDCEEILVQSGYNWDLASAFALALDKGDKVRGEIFNISSAKAVTLKEFLAKAMDVLGSKSEIVRVSNEELLGMKQYNVHWHYGLDFLLLHMCFDISKARNILGYNPKVSTLEGLEKALTDLVNKGEL